MVIVQIEHVEAIRNIDSILEVQGVDGTFVGPYDLSGSMDLTGQIDHPRVQDAVQRVLAACKKHKKAAGIHVVPVNPDLADKYIDDGFTFIALSLDSVILRDGCNRMLGKK